MKRYFYELRKTTNTKYVGIIRILIGILILMTGMMKIAIPPLREAFWQQLNLAQLPFPTFSLWFVPIIEVITGILLLIGSYSRLASLTVMGMMIVATYVHLVVKDANAFPLQPTAPIIPIFVIVMGAVIVWRGSGAWSRDLKVTVRSKTENLE